MENKHCSNCNYVADSPIWCKAAMQCSDHILLEFWKPIPVKLSTIGELIQAELDRANEKFPQFASSHEGYAILLEEIEEAENEMNSIKSWLEELWEEIKLNDLEHQKIHIEDIQDRAKNAIEELIQVAAMCEKFSKLFEAAEKEG